MSFANKVVLVTGGSSGIGAAVAILFSQEDANVVIVGRNETKLYNVAEQCKVKPLVIKADVTVTDEAKAMVDKTIDTFGKIDVLVNNAGIVRYGRISEKNYMETYDELMVTNLRAVIDITRSAMPYLVATKGNIVNISSIAGVGILVPELVPYSISKAGLDHFTRGIAMELADKGVRVNAISPGPVRTDILENAGDKTPWEVVGNGTLLGKVAEPEEIGDLVLFLASDKAKSVTGSNYVCDNGSLLKK